MEERICIERHVKFLYNFGWVGVGSKMDPGKLIHNLSQSHAT